MALLIEVAGFALLAVAALLWNLIAGIAITGGELLFLGFLVDYTGAEPRFPKPHLPHFGKPKVEGQ